MDFLRRFRTEQTIEERWLETEWVESDRLFVKWDGRPMNPQTPYGWLKEFCEKNEHLSRHTQFSSLCSICPYFCRT